VSFEEAYRQLEETVRRLEQGDLSIDEMVALFERGMALAQLCNARLDAAELRISQLVSRPDGSVEVAAFEG
jgi:exodeoxyribonuclease VII small subunit